MITISEPLLIAVALAIGGALVGLSLVIFVLSRQQRSDRKVIYDQVKLVGRQAAQLRSLRDHVQVVEAKSIAGIQALRQEVHRLGRR